MVVYRVVRSLTCTCQARPHHEPHRLPLTHATSWASFCAIVRDGRLRASFCPVFREHLVYFFCGTVARRASDRSVPWGRSESPVVLIFDPSLARHLHRFYPFDTGALAASRIGTGVRSGWVVQDFRTEFEFQITSGRTPADFISAIYGTSAAYFAGVPLHHVCNLRERIERIRGIVAGDSALGTDYRRFSLECQSQVSVPLKPFLCEVWVPASAKPELSQIRGANLCIRIYEDKKAPHSVAPITKRVRNRNIRNKISAARSDNRTEYLAFSASVAPPGFERLDLLSVGPDLPARFEAVRYPNS
jgi:hypothetical protein